MSDPIEAGEGEGGEGTGSEAQPWLTSIPEPLRGHEAFKGLEKQADVFQKFVDLTEKSKGSLTIPSNKATDEERAAFYAKLGRPESADKYSYTRPADLPDEIPYNADVEAAYKQLFFKVGLSDAQAKEITETHLNLAKQGLELQQKATKEATEKAVNALKDEWKGDAYKENSELAVRAFRELGGGEEFKAFIENTKVDGVALGNHPLFLKVFANIGKKISDDSINSGRDGHKGELSEEDKARNRFPNTKFK